MNYTLVGNYLVYQTVEKMTEVQNISKDTQVEAQQPKSLVFGRYIKEVAGSENFAKQQSHIAEKKLDEHQVYVEALQTTKTAADSIYCKAEYSGPNEISNKLFQKLATNNSQEMTFNAEMGELSYRDLQITASTMYRKL